MKTESESQKKPSKNEFIKESSQYLRGTILEGLRDESTGAVSDDDTQLMKFHGLYQQDDRDVRSERRKQKLEKAFSFMIRVAVPGGVATPEQYLVMDRLADECANGTIRLTTRQAFQLHGVLKGNVQQVVRGINDVLLSSLAACGDVNRNVMCDPNPDLSPIHTEVLEHTKAVQKHLLPRSTAYHEIYVEGELTAGGPKEEEPIYGKYYLPRKFKIGFAVPPGNGIDVLSQDLGFVAIIEDGKLAGFNVTAGGGMGRSHNNEETYPRLADTLGYITPDQVIAIAEAVVTTQRDYGDRSDRKHARLKYTIDDRGLDWFKNEVEQRSGITFQPAKPFELKSIMDDYGWKQAMDGTWLFGLFIQNGRISGQMRDALRRIAKLGVGEFRLSPSQNLILAKIPEERKGEINAILEEFDLADHSRLSGLRRNSMACPALPTCGLALAESERYIPDLLDELEKVIDEAGLRDEDISIRMTGCPNGCARPYLAEIGLVGRSPGKYNIYLGAKYDGTRLNDLWADAVPSGEIAATLAPVLQRFAKEREDGEQFGDFCRRVAIV
ncbi:MAG: NADPH-dependent assimilatory sulfite reductase hemoprotein subunit [Verrucomicrobiae bacterium]|nr:NADPH-dependent assimilatory sulfite reductase hemoprotein subunit [Verrucomicrobiae bacterium]